MNERLETLEEVLNYVQKLKRWHKDRSTNWDGIGSYFSMGACNSIERWLKKQIKGVRDGAT